MRKSEVTEAEVEQAIRQVQGGSAASYGLVVQFYARRLRALVAKHCPPSVETDEIAHLTFVTAYREIQRYQTGTQFFGWMGSIARMLILAELKRVKRDSQNRQNYLEYETAQGLEEMATDPAEAGEAKIRALRTCTSQLSEEHQSLLRLRYAEDCSIQNLSDRLNKTLSAVKVQLFFIRKKLRDCVSRRMSIQKQA
ncbi:MAG TPA: sigma-70 family RNA polymerase sigma factor [Planctomycetota bacterium]|jgi:RNA polymerase sigma-70 factor (ECF subfamily)|nr:sigma-70 family RNA polymerase sigma factor [Planctomycetota bacterium]